MEIKTLRKLIEKPEFLNKELAFYQKKKIIQKALVDIDEIKGHIEKSEHNLQFVLDNIKIGYYDWCITGCYYAVYQIALALIRAKEYSSKNHDATLCILIKDYYKKGISQEDIELINIFFLDYQDILFYVHSKDKREEASYGAKYNFDKDKIEELRLKTIDFVNKGREIVESLLNLRR